MNLPVGKYGEENPNWKGGLTKSTRGYWYVKQPEHHRADKNGYVKRADLVLEQKLGRLLRDDEIAHHDNEDKEDDAPENLISMTLEEHSAHHNKPRKPKKTKRPGHPNNRRYTWPSEEALLEMYSHMSLREIAGVIGCSWAAVWRRLKRHSTTETP